MSKRKLKHHETANFRGWLRRNSFECIANRAIFLDKHWSALSDDEFDFLGELKCCVGELSRRVNELVGGE